MPLQRSGDQILQRDDDQTHHHSAAGSMYTTTQRALGGCRLNEPEFGRDRQVRIGSKTSHPGEPDQRPRAGTSRAPPLGGVTSGGTCRSRIGTCRVQVSCGVPKGRPECLIINIQPPRSTSAWAGPAGMPGARAADPPWPPLPAVGHATPDAHMAPDARTQHP